MNESINIDLSSNSKSIVKIGLLIRASVILIFSIATGIGGLYFVGESLVAGLIFFLISLIFLLVFLKILSAVFFKEKLVVTKASLTVIHKSLSNSREQVFNLNDILYFGFANQQYTPHPLDNPVIDFIGVATQEKEMQYVIDEGNIKLETKTKAIKFGKNMPSWDVEEVIEKVENFTGRKFAKPHQPVSNVSITLKDEDSDEVEPVDATNEDGDIETASNEPTTKYRYDCDEGVLIIEQKQEIPSANDIAYLNGSLAPSAKYRIGENKFVLVSNGNIYAIRGFDKK